jgi:hypothetical protein
MKFEQAEIIEMGPGGENGGWTQSDHCHTLAADEADNTYIMVAIDGFSRFKVNLWCSSRPRMRVVRQLRTRLLPVLKLATLDYRRIYRPQANGKVERRSQVEAQSTKKTAGTFGLYAGIDGSRTIGAACCLLSSSLLSSGLLYTRAKPGF